MRRLDKVLRMKALPRAQLHIIPERPEYSLAKIPLLLHGQFIIGFKSFCK